MWARLSEAKKEEEEVEWMKEREAMRTIKPHSLCLMNKKQISRKNEKQTDAIVGVFTLCWHYD